MPVVFAISHFGFHLDITASEQKKKYAFLFRTQERTLGSVIARNVFSI
jgi:hypothetical protein